VLDVPTLTPTPTDGTLTLNALGKVEIEMQNGLVADRYDEHVETGAFILIDPASHQTVAAGLVR
jgi:sulfate adenylyltransferase subunit 1 (EFTu-like GTPase family)